MKNEKGFVLATTLALLPCLLAGFLLCYSAVGIIRNDLSLKYICRSQGLQTQQKVAPYLHSLLRLNPLAKTLKIAHTAAELKLKAAWLSKNPALISAAKIQLAQIEHRRAVLDRKQKQFIENSNRMMAETHRRTFVLLQRHGQNLTNHLLWTQLKQVYGSPPQLAVRPQSSDVAPTYAPTANFEQRQALAHEWQYQTQVRPPFSNFLKGIFVFKKSCQVTLTKEGASWVAKIIRDKSSLNSAW